MYLVYFCYSKGTDNYFNGLDLFCLHFSFVFLVLGIEPRALVLGNVPAFFYLFICFLDAGSKLLIFAFITLYLTSHLIMLFRDTVAYFNILTMRDIMYTHTQIYMPSMIF